GRQQRRQRGGPRRRVHRVRGLRALAEGRPLGGGGRVPGECGGGPALQRERVGTMVGGGLGRGQRRGAVARLQQARRQVAGFERLPAPRGGGRGVGLAGHGGRGVEQLLGGHVGGAALGRGLA